MTTGSWKLLGVATPRRVLLPLLAGILGLALLSSPAVYAQGTEVQDEFEGTSLNTALWTPYSLTFSHAGNIDVSGGVVTISPTAEDPRVGDSRFGLLSNAFYGTQSTVEATVESFEGVNAILRLQGRNGAFVELGLDANLDLPLHVWRSYPENSPAWEGGAGTEAPVTLGVARNGDTLEFYTISNGQRTVHTTQPVASLGEVYRVLLYGFAGSTTVWSSFRGTGALPAGAISGIVTGPGAAGARVSTGDTLLPPVIADASGNFSFPAPVGTYTVTASSLAGAPASSTVTVTEGMTATVNLTLTDRPEAPIYDDFEGTSLDESKWTPVTVEGQGAPVLTVADGQLVIEGSDIRSWRRNGVMSNTAFGENSVVRIKLDPNPGDVSWHPFVALWDGAGVPNWNTQPHVEVEFRRDINRLQLNGGRAAWVSGEADQMLFAPFDTLDLPAVFTIVRTGNTFDFYIRGDSDTEDRHAFSTTTSNLSGPHRIVLYTFTPEGMGEAHNTSTWDYVAASDPVTTGMLQGKITVGGASGADAGLLVASETNTITVRPDDQGNFSLPLNPGTYTVTAVAYGFNRQTQEVTIASGETRTLNIDITGTAPINLEPYDDFSGSELDQSRWRTFSEEGTGEGFVRLEDGNLVLEGPGAGNRWGVQTTAQFPAAFSVAETTVQSVQDFGPGALNAILQLYTAESGFRNFIEFGIETLSAEGLPMLHVWGPESGDFHTPAPSDFPLKLTVVRRGNDLDFFANNKYVHSVTTNRLEGDHRIFLYGYGASVPTFTELLVAAPTVPSRPLGDVSGDNQVTVIDVIPLLRSIVGLQELTEEERTAADVDRSGAANIVDAVLILRFAAGLITEFPGAAG